LFRTVQTPKSKWHLAEHIMAALPHYYTMRTSPHTNTEWLIHSKLEGVSCAAKYSCETGQNKHQK